MKILRLSGSDAQEWARNIPKLVDTKGNVVRDATKEEIIEAQKANNLGKAYKVTVTVPAHLLNSKEEFVRVATAKEVAAKTKTVLVKEKGDKTATKYRMVSKRIIECSIASGRDLLCKQYFEKHGECQIRRHTGQVLKTIRDPSRTHETSAVGISNTLGQPYTQPQHCECKDWGVAGSHTGRHHYVCPMNQVAPEDERSPIPEDGVDRSTPLMQASSSVSSSEDRENPQQPSAAANSPGMLSPGIFSPKDCPFNCREWAMPDGSKPDPEHHHPVCQYFESWESQNRGTVCFLISLEDGSQVRVASSAEVLEAEREYAESGTTVIKVGDTKYAVQGEGWEPKVKFEAPKPTAGSKKPAKKPVKKPVKGKKQVSANVDG